MQKKKPPKELFSMGKQIYKPSSVLDNHLSRPCISTWLKRRTRGRDEQPLYVPLFGLASSGVYIAAKSPMRW